MISLNFKKNSLISVSSKAVLKILSGLALSQIIMLLGYIFLTKLYSPSQFGVLAIIMSVSAILGPLLVLRMEISILIEKYKPVSDVCLFFSVITAVILAFISGAFLIFFSFIFDTSWRILAWVIPIFSFGNILMLLTDFYLNRHKKHFYMAIIPVINSTVIIVSSIIYKDFENGLIWGILTAYSIVTIFCIFFLFKPFMIGYKISTKKRFSYWCKKNKEFVFYTTPAAFLNLLATNLPVLIIGALFGTQSLGFYSLMSKFLLAPVALISGSINKIAIERISRAINNKESVLNIIKKISVKVAIFSLGVILIYLFFIYVNGFSIIFSEEWDVINTISLYFLPSVYFALVAKSTSRFAVFRRNKMGLIFQSILLTCVIAGIYVPYAYGINFENTILILSIVLSLVYFFQLILFYKIANTQDLKNIRLIK